MKKLCFIATFLIGFSACALAQDLKITKNQVIVVGGIEEAVIEENSKGRFTIKSLETEDDLVFIRLVNPTKEGQYSEFIDDYFIFSFPDHDDEVEYRKFKMFDAIKFLYDNKVIEAGRINKDKLNEFVERYKKKP